MNLKRDQIEEPDILFDPGWEAAERDASRYDPSSVTVAELDEFFITA